VSDKSFKVKSGLQIPSITSASILRTDSSGNISSGGVLPVENGGTGQTSANNALNSFLPLQGEGTINYVLQSNGTDTAWGKLYYQAIKNNGTTVTPRAYLNIVGGSFADSSGSDTTTITLGSASTDVSSDITLAAANKYFVDTTSARTLTLPASPSLGDEIVIYDASNNALTNNITVASNSNKVQGSVQDLIIDSNAAVVYLAYTGSTYGWAVN
jgi:hypothetical protein